MKTTRRAFCALTGLAGAEIRALARESKLRLWYRSAARNWNEALPVGNGRLGAMVYGGVAQERLQLNEDTLWSGAPSDWNNPKAREVLPLVRQAVNAGRYDEADRLSKQMQGPYTTSYMPMGDLLLDFDGVEGASEYERELDLERALASIRFRAGGGEYERAVFSSYPDQVIVVRLTGSASHPLNFRAKLTSRLRYQTKGMGSDRLVLKGKAPKHVVPQYLWQIKDEQAIQYSEDASGEGMNFEVHLLAVAEGGSVTADADHLTVKAARSVTLLISAATSYNGYDKSPGLAGKDPAPQAEARLNAAAGKSYDELLKDHLKDYRPLFGRLRFDLGETPQADLPTDERLKSGIANDPALMTLVYQYGRYLLLATSRPGGQPGNLKGIWNDRVRPEWSSNWCIDHDAQMYYYPVETANLAEMHEPFLDLIDDVAVNGRKTARVNYGMGGWCSHHNTDLWRQTGAAGNWGEGNPHWASFALSGPWLAQHFWEHFAFGGDVEFLRRRAWPVMRGAAEFCLEWLVEDGRGHLVTNPSVSPENTFVMEDGKPAQISMASTVDISLIWDLFTNCLEAARVMGTETDFARRLEAARARLLPPEIGRKGQLQEWFKDWESADPGHRHLSHLFGVFPGRQFSPLKTPALTEAAKKSLRMRDVSQYGWSLAWKAACWARLGEGDEAYRRLSAQVTHVDSEAKQNGSGWLFPNLFNADPPFVLLNGNLCITAAVTEMLVQSHLGEIHLLPALPSAWKRGDVSGIRARGGFVVDVHWADGELKKATVISELGNSCRLRSATKVSVKLSGTRVKTREAGSGLIEFPTRAGGTYFLRGK
jgi:alpha-L-fucosidase 2